MQDLKKKEWSVMAAQAVVISSAHAGIFAGLFFNVLRVMSLHRPWLFLLLMQD
jgi:hypothetical protein